MTLTTVKFPQCRRAGVETRLLLGGIFIDWALRMVPLDMHTQQTLDAFRVLNELFGHSLPPVKDEE